MPNFRVSENYAAKRVDSFITVHEPKLTRSFIQTLCDTGKVRINDKSAKPSRKLKNGDLVSVDYDLSQLDKVADIKLLILYEDNDCIVIDKPAGVLTHSKGAFNPEATVASFVKPKLTGLSGERAGIVHRLDRATSGVIICAKNAEALKWLQQQFSNHKVLKTYVAIIKGQLAPREAVIDMPIERNPAKPQTFRVGEHGKSAITEYKTVRYDGTYSQLELTPKTGRTHQLRVHLKQLGHPIVGDQLYGGKEADRLYLHATQLKITLPDHKHKTFISKLPQSFAKLMRTND